MPAFDLSTIVRERKPDGESFPAEYLEMQSTRRAFLRAWNVWLRTGPSENDVNDEAESTSSAFRQVTDVSFTPTPRPSRYQPRRGR